MSQILRTLPDNEYQAAINANSPSAANPFLTVADLPSTGGLYAQTSSSAPVTPSGGPATLIGAGVGVLSVPANGFQVGDSFHAVMSCIISSANSQDFQIDVLANGNVLGSTGVIRLPQITNKKLEFEIDFTIRQLGAATVSEIVSGGIMTYVKDSSDAFEGATFSTINNTTFDTTVLNTLDIRATWTGTDIANSIVSQLFVLSKTY